MRVDTAIGSALQGIRNGQQKADESALTIANASLGERQGQRDSTAALADLQTARRDVQANAKVIRTADEALGTLIDTEA